MNECMEIEMKEEKKCAFCGQEKEYKGGKLTRVWFENQGENRSWKYLKENEIAHADCYIELIVFELIETAIVRIRGDAFGLK